jgi:23S rRNA pseudouridine1911/1915/1917 synthase
MTRLPPDPETPDQEELLLATVPDEASGQRLDVVCARLFDEYSRARLQQWIRDGRVLVNGAAVVRAREPVNAGDRLVLDAEPQPDFRVEPQNIPITVLHADADLAVVVKPAGLTVHPGAGQADQTLQNALLFHLPQTASVPRAGIVHRLDKDTSGLLMVALNLTAHADLVAQLGVRTVHREYDAITQGPLIAGGTIDAPIGRHPHERTKMAVLPRGGREAITHYRVAQHFGHHSHLSVRLETGRTHQIRVHLAHIRHPLVGDLTYGAQRVRGGGLPVPLRAALEGFPRQALHARTLGFMHPRSGAALEFSQPPPQDMQDLLDALAQYDPRDDG